MKGSEFNSKVVSEVAINKYFLDMGFKLLKDLPPPAITIGRWKVEIMFKYQLITVSQLEIRGGSAPVYDNVLPSILKNNITNLQLLLTHVIYLNMELGNFIDRFKIVKVIPIFKSDDKSKISNFHLISLLSVLSKVLGKYIKLQFQEYYNMQ